MTLNSAALKGVAMRKATSFSPSLLTLGLVALLGLIVVTPMLLLVFASFVDTPPRPGATSFHGTLANYRAIINSSTLSALYRTVVIGLGGTALAALWGVGLAWLAARTNVPFRRLIQFAGIVPLFVSPLIGAVAYSFLASPRQGLINIALRGVGIDLTLHIYTIPGIIFVFGLYYAPYIYLLVYSSLTLSNPELEESASVHGASLARVARHVTLPLALPALAGGSILAFALIVEDFPVPQVLGASNGLYTLPTFIYRLMSTPPTSPNRAAALGVLLTLVMTALVLIQRRHVAGREYTTVTGKGLHLKSVNLGVYRWLGAAVAGSYFLFAIALPVIALAVISFRDNVFVGSMSSLLSPRGWTVEHVVQTLQYEPLQSGLQNSLLSGLMAAVFGGVLYFVMAYVVYRTGTGRGRGLVEVIASLPLAMPALVLGMAILWTWLVIPIPLYGTIGILVLAYIARFMPQGFRGTSSSMLQIHHEVEEAARVSGANRLRATAEILLPLMRTSIFATCLLVLILSMRELSASIFLFTSDTRVLSIVLYDQYDKGFASRAAVIGLVYMVVLGLITFAGRRYLEPRGS